jgi:hypothetical protein
MPDFDALLSWMLGSLRNQKIHRFDKVLHPHRELVVNI